MFEESISKSDNIAWNTKFEYLYDTKIDVYHWMPKKLSLEIRCFKNIKEEYEILDKYGPAELTRRQTKALEDLLCQENNSLKNGE